MASSRIKGLTIEIDGDVTGLNSALKSVDKQLNTTSSSLNDINKLLKFDPGNADLLKQKQEALADAIQATTKRLQTLQTAQTQMKASGVDESSDEYKALQREIVATQQKLQKYTKEANNAGNETKDAGNKAEKSASNVKKLGSAAETVRNDFSTAKAAVAEFAGNVLTKLAEGITKAVSSFANLSDSTMEYRENMAKLNTAAESAGNDAGDVSSAYGAMYEVLGDGTAATTTISNFLKLGVTTKQLDSLVESATGIWATYGDSIPLDGLAESVNETAKVGTITGTLADALNWAGVKEDDFNESLAACGSEQERQQKIIDTLNGLYSESAAAYEDNNASVIEARRANLLYEDSIAQIGAAIEPVKSAITSFGAELIDKVSPYVQQFASEFPSAFESVKEKASNFIAAIQPTFENLKSIIGSIKDSLQPVIDKFDEMGGAGGAISGIANTLNSISSAAASAASAAAPIVSTVFAWIVEHGEVVKTTLAAIAGGLIALKTAQTAVTVAQTAMNLVMNANPIMLIITAVGALVAAFLYLWNNCEGFREFWIALFEKLKEVAGTVLEAIKNFFTAAWDGIKAVWETVQPYFAAIWEGIKAVFTTVADVIGGFFSMAWDNIKIVWDVVTGYFQMIWENIKLVFGVVKDVLSGDFSGAWDKIKQIWDNVKGYFSGVWDGVKNIFANVKGFFQDKFSGAWDAIKGVFDKVKGLASDAWNWGADIIQGIIDGIKSMVGKVTGAVSDVAETIKSYLHFSVPDKGPLTDFESWMPDFMQGLAKGIQQNKKVVESAISGVADSMQMDFGGTLALTNGHTGGTINNYYNTDNSRTVNQTNNSPKSLSRLEIYRQTHNALTV